MGEIRDTERHFPSLQIRGFGDVDFSGTDQKGSVSGFNLGQLVLHLASPLSEKVSYFGEISFTAQPTGYELSVERSIIRYDYNDYFKLSFGKYHTPIGYWNATFHHGAWLQTTIARPEMVQFGGTFIPTHFVGLEAEGNIPSGGLGLGYNVGIGNGRSSLLSKSGDSGDSNDNRAWVANVYARPSRFYGLQVGASVYRDKLTPQPDRTLANGSPPPTWSGPRRSRNFYRNTPTSIIATKLPAIPGTASLSMFSWRTGCPGSKANGSLIIDTSIFISLQMIRRW